MRVLTGPFLNGVVLFGRGIILLKKKESTSTFTYYWVGAPGLGGHEPGLPNGQ